MDKQAHWENVYQTKGRDEVSWFAEHLDTSLRLITRNSGGKEAAIIDVGGGNSNLVDDLLEKGFTNLSTLDISAKALNDSKERLGKRADRVNWIAADIINAELPHDHFDVWHDRAVFHFQTANADRQKYIECVKRSVRPGGHVIIASFSLDGPMKCSGLEVVRYSPESLGAEFGMSFELVETTSETHKTPFGTEQDFIYCVFRKQ